MLSALFSGLADYFRAQLFDDPSAGAQAAHYDSLATSERTHEAFEQSRMFDHSTSFDHSSMFDQSSSFGSDSFGSDSFGGGSSSFD